MSVQAACRPAGGALLAACLLLAGCSDPLGAPVDFFHGLEGGEIAANRPPPPGVGQPYPKLGTVPARPTVVTAAYRQALQAQLAAERDAAERAAADTPIERVPPPPPPVTPAAPGAPPPTAQATLASAEAPPVPTASPVLPTALPATAAPSPALPSPAEAPAPLPAQAASPQPGAALPLPRPSPSAAPSADTGLAPDAPVTLAGAPADFAAAPTMPDAPPPPATFEGVAAEPAPTPRPLPSHLAGTPAGTRIFFAPASAVLPASQAPTLHDLVARRKTQTIEILGLGDAASDTPDGQATAIALGLARARAVAEALEGLHVPPASLRVGADAFGRGAVLRLLP